MTTAETAPELVRGSVALRPRARRRYALVAVAAVVLGLLALGVWQLTQNCGSSVVSRTRSVAPFSSLSSPAATSSRSAGARQSVVVHAHANMLDHVTTQVVRGDLVIGDAHTRHATKGPVSVSVWVPSLNSGTIPRDGGGIITVTGIDTPSFTVTLDQLVARDALAVVSGSGRIVITATRSLNASVTGDGVIQYAGNPPKLAMSVTGNGVIIPAPTG
jgi:putative autotransporter adhesin-like protein